MRSASQQQGGGSIMSRNNKEDDEDELEALRLAALESLRAKGLPPPVVLQGQRLSPKHNVCSNAVFQRHFGNQNLIAIIPVENNSASSSPYQNSSPHHPPSLDSKPPPMRNNSSRPPPLKNPPTTSLVSHNSPVEEKRSNKFSRFEDSDSDESDDVEMSFAKSESEEEEFVIEEGDAEDLIIEVEDEIIEEIEEESNGATELSPAVATIPEDRVNVATSGVKPSEKSASPSGQISTPTPPVKITMTDSTKEGHASRDVRHFESNRKTDTGEFARRSPQLSSSATRSPPNAHSRRRSPPRQQRSPQRMQKSSPRPHRSPPRSQRSPVRVQRSPVRIQRSPSRVQRSPLRVQRSPPRVQRSPLRRSPLRSSDRDKPKDRGTSKTSSGSDRSGPEENKRADKKRVNTSVDSVRSSEQRRTSDKSRSPTCERKPLLKRSPPRSVSNDSRDSRKLVTPSLTETERDRLESRKRKFETAPDQDSSVKKEGKIRLRTEINRKTPPVQLKRREEKLTKKPDAVVEQIQVRRDEPISSVPDKTDEEDVDRKSSKKNKRSSKKSKDKNRNGKTLSGSDGDNAPVKPLSNKSSETSDAHLDLRAELQRRRGHRYEEDEEPRSRTPETRRILVLNSPPTSTASAAPPKLPTEPSGVLSKHQRLVSEGQSKPGTSSSSGSLPKRNGRVKLKRTLLATPIEIDQGPETDPLEDRIRLIRAQNELIRKRQREIEADKLQYA
ncbi:serine/arginine repetitive matrix protein 1-like isoform X2 [Daphnia pulicaria]|uniref:serine/arginine repetitive matrix protein 1-like isoform X2 n=1 Tax=Daphnia pulicaria TaxID=35523 RepID=UPI001EEB39F3|nr:serine/arginine repetitive matrix protein 1-like isoform X2 [Daphnia pulicaria]